MRREVLRMERVTYHAYGTTYLQDFNLNIFEGEIMGLLPVNAYGLPSLLDILRYNPSLYDGYIYYRGQQVDSWQDIKRTNSKISVIRDKSSLVDGQSVAYNIFVLRPGFKQEILHSKMIKQQLQPFLDEIHMSISPDTPVERLSFFERIVVELLRAIVAGHQLIVIQEISTMVSDSDLRQLHDIIKYYAKAGFSFLYISPHFEEHLQICTRTAIMKHGRITKILQGSEMEQTTIDLYSKEYDDKVRNHREYRRQLEEQPIIFESKGISGTHIKNLEFYVRRGECIVLQMLEHKIFNEFCQVIMGEESYTGTILIDGKYAKLENNRNLAVIQEQPTRTMLFYDMSYMDNLCMNIDHRMPRVWLDSKIRRSIKKEYTKVLGSQVFDKKIQDLTEMEKYELAYTRILLQKPQVVFCILPFKGADLAHRLRIWELQEMLLKKGIAVVILAVNMSDAMAPSDRVIKIQ